MVAVHLSDLHCDVIEAVRQSVDLQIGDHLVHLLGQSQNSQHELSLMLVRNLKGPIICQFLHGFLVVVALRQNGAKSCVHVEQVNSSVPSRVQHGIKRELVARHSVLSQVKVLDRGDADRLSCGFNVLFFQMRFVFSFRTCKAYLPL